MIRVFVCLLVFLLSNAVASAQSAARGQVVAPVGVALENFFVDVQPVGGAGIGQKVPVSANGFFYFDANPGQSYSLTVLDLSGNIIAQDVANPGVLDSVEIHLTIPAQRNRPVSGTVSLYELQHKVPSKAIKEGKEADKYFAKRNLPAYIEHASKAIALDPGWTVARRNLGIAYMMSGEDAKAAEQFQEVLKLDRHSGIAYAALSCAYIGLSRFPQAEDAARHAVDIDPGSDLSRYYLGVSLAMQRKNNSQALHYLQTTSSRFPKGHILIAHILERLGMKQAAREQLQAYLSSGDTAAKSQVKSWLSLLK